MSSREHPTVRNLSTSIPQEQALEVYDQECQKKIICLIIGCPPLFLVVAVEQVLLDEFPVSLITPLNESLFDLESVTLSGEFEAVRQFTSSGRV